MCPQNGIFSLKYSHFFKLARRPYWLSIFQTISEFLMCSSSVFPVMTTSSRIHWIPEIPSRTFSIILCQVRMWFPWPSYDSGIIFMVGSSLLVLSTGSCKYTCFKSICEKCVPSFMLEKTSSIFVSGYWSKRSSRFIVTLKSPQILTFPFLLKTGMIGVAQSLCWTFVSILMGSSLSSSSLLWRIWAYFLWVLLLDVIPLIVPTSSLNIPLYFPKISLMFVDWSVWTECVSLITFQSSWIFFNQSLPRIAGLPLWTTYNSYVCILYLYVLSWVSA